MKTYSAREIIKKAYGTSKNFITPNIIKYGKISKTIAFELSSGSSMSGGTMYGVSIAKIIKGGKAERQYNLSKSFYTIYKAERYIEALKRKYKR